MSNDFLCVEKGMHCTQFRLLLLHEQWHHQNPEQAVTALVAPTPLGTCSTLWVVSESCERKKTAPAEDDWNLAGTTPVRSRTRYAGTRRPLEELLRAVNIDSSDEEEQESQYSGPVSSEDDSLLYASDASFENDTTLAKPESSRVILEVDPLLDMIERNTLCKLCSGPVKVDVKNITLASTVKLFCLDKKSCGYLDHMRSPAVADIPDVFYEAETAAAKLAAKKAKKKKLATDEAAKKVELIPSLTAAMELFSSGEKNFTAFSDTNNDLFKNLIKYFYNDRPKGLSIMKKPQLLATITALFEKV